MAWQQPKGALTKGRILPGSPIAESVERRSREVGTLLRAPRKLALAFKRTRSEADRAELRELDDVLSPRSRSMMTDTGCGPSSLSYRYRETVYRITVAQSVDGDGGTRITVGGVEQDETRIPLVDDHREHRVEVAVQGERLG